MINLMAQLREVIPVGFVRIIDSGEQVCDAPEKEVMRMFQCGEIYWDSSDEEYTLTPTGRVWLKRRFLN